MPPSLPIAVGRERLRVTDFVGRVCVRALLYQSPAILVPSPPPDADAA
jgi:hypothetical protein